MSCFSFSLPFLFYNAVLSFCSWYLISVIHKAHIMITYMIHHLLSLFRRKFQECPLLWRSLNRLLPHRLPVANRLPPERWKATRMKSPKLHRSLSNSGLLLFLLRWEDCIVRNFRWWGHEAYLHYRNVNMLGTLFIAVCCSAALASFVTACFMFESIFIQGAVT